jgi:hypothetical protein
MIEVNIDQILIHNRRRIDMGKNRRIALLNKTYRHAISQEGKTRNQSFSKAFLTDVTTE